MRNVWVLLVMVGFGCGSMTQLDAGTDAGVQADAGVQTDAGADPLVKTWPLHGSVTTSGGSVFNVSFAFAITAFPDGTYKGAGGGCSFVFQRDTTASLPTFHLAGSTSTSCAPTFLTATFTDGSPLTLDGARQVRIDVSTATLKLAADQLSLSGTGNAGYADGVLADISWSVASN